MCIQIVFLADLFVSERYKLLRWTDFKHLVLTSPIFRSWRTSYMKKETTWKTLSIVANVAAWSVTEPLAINTAHLKPEAQLSLSPSTCLNGWFEGP